MKKEPKWNAGYKEVKNVFHNEMGITPNEVRTMARKMLQEEINHVVGQNGEFIRYAMKQVIREEMHNALINEHYPSMKGNMNFYDKNGKNPFNKYISQVMKEEVSNMLREQFDVGINIIEKKKE